MFAPESVPAYIVKSPVYKNHKIGYTLARMNLLNLISIVSSFVSLFLGIFAIALSLVLYRWSTEANERSQEAARNIESSVKRLEQLFDKLYSDTFSMVKDTYTDIRQHMWPSVRPSDQVDEVAERKADQRVAQVKKSLDSELTRLLEKQTHTDTQLQMLTSEVRALLNRAITETRRIEEESRDESVREVILRQLGTMETGVTLGDMTDLMNDKFGIGASEVIDELEKLNEEGIIAWPSKRNPATAQIVLKQKLPVTP